MEKIRRFVHIDDFANVIGSEITFENVKLDVPSTAELEEEYHSDDESRGSSSRNSSKRSPTRSNDSNMDFEDEESSLSLMSYSSMDEVIPEGIDWPNSALIRFFHLITSNGLEYKNIFEHTFLQYLSFKMKFISSDDPLISDVYIHNDDLEKYQNASTANDSLLEYFKPNYDIDCSPTIIKSVIEKFYNLTSTWNDDDNEIGGYSYSPQPPMTPEPQTTPSSLSRSRRTGRANPLVKAIVDEKKQHSRKSSNA